MVHNAAFEAEEDVADAPEADDSLDDTVSPNEEYLPEDAPKVENSPKDKVFQDEEDFLEGDSVDYRSLQSELRRQQLSDAKFLRTASESFPSTSEIRLRKAGHTTVRVSVAVLVLLALYMLIVPRVVDDHSGRPRLQDNMRDRGRPAVGEWTTDESVQTSSSEPVSESNVTMLESSEESDSDGNSSETDDMGSAPAGEAVLKVEGVDQAQAAQDFKPGDPEALIQFGSRRAFIHLHEGSEGVEVTIRAEVNSWEGRSEDSSRIVVDISIEGEQALTRSEVVFDGVSLMVMRATRAPADGDNSADAERVFVTAENRRTTERVVVEARRGYKAIIRVFEASIL